MVTVFRYNSPEEVAPTNQSTDLAPPEISAFAEDTSSIENASFPVNSILNWTKAHQQRSLNFPKITFGKEAKIV